MNLKKFYYKIKQNKMLRDIAPYVELSDNSIYENGFNVRFDQKPNERVYLKVASDSMIGGTFIFESSEGYISVGQRSQISGGATLISHTSIIIGDDVVIAGGGTLIYDHDSHSIYPNERMKDVTQQIDDIRKFDNATKNKNWSVVKSAPITIKKGVWIGIGVTILKGVTIGEFAVVGAKSVVTHDVEPYSVVAGNPARVIKRIQNGDK